jgi:pimeloyl-ACP methyl ester carboxylesterase
LVASVRVILRHYGLTSGSLVIDDTDNQRSKSAEPLVLQHGFGDRVETWYELGYVDALKDDYRLILIDARGHGASDKPHEPEVYSFQNVTADVVAVLDNLVISRAHYFGFSMGGKNGFAFAAYAPERLSSLIILGTGASAQDHGPLDLWIASLRQGPEAVASIWELDAPVSPALRQRLVSNDPEALIAQRIQRKNPLGFDDILPTLSIPCLLMVGEADAAYGRVKTCSRLIRDVTFISFPGLGHTGSFLNRAELVQHIRQFLQGLTKERV